MAARRTGALARCVASHDEAPKAAVANSNNHNDEVEHTSTTAETPSNTRQPAEAEAQATSAPVPNNSIASTEPEPAGEPDAHAAHSPDSAATTATCCAARREMAMRRRFATFSTNRSCRQPTTDSIHPTVAARPSWNGVGATPPKRACNRLESAWL